MRLNRKWILVIALVLSVAMVTGGTLAYLTDTDSDVNVMTLGYVKIAQIEQQRDGNGGLEDFEQGKVLLPVTNTDNPINWPKGENVDGVTLPTVENFVDKIVTVDNVGRQDAYVRVLIAFPAEMDDDTSADNMMMRWIYDVNEANGTWSRTGGDVTINIDGRSYNVYNCTYKSVLHVKETTTSPAITGVFMNSKVDATYDETTGAITYFMKTENGTIKSATYAEGENPKLYVLSQAVQADGFADANTALTAGFGEVTVANKDNVQSWFGGMEAQAPVVTTVSNADELKDALVNGASKIVLANDIAVDKWVMFSESLSVASGNIITVEEINVTIDGDGHTLTVNSIESAGNGNRLFYDATKLNISNLTIKYADGLAGGIGLTSGVISNVNFEGGNYAILPGSGDIKVENCTFKTNADAIYSEKARDNLTVTGCTFNQPNNANVILLRGNVKFTNNTVNSGRTVNIVSGSPVVTGNNFNGVRLKVYSAATATISNNTINNLEFETTTYSSTFGANTLSAEAQNALNDATKN